jgi:hypothetical protein
LTPGDYTRGHDPAHEFPAKEIRSFTNDIVGVSEIQDLYSYHFITRDKNRSKFPDGESKNTWIDQVIPEDTYIAKVKMTINLDCHFLRLPNPRPHAPSYKQCYCKFLLNGLKFYGPDGSLLL